MDARIAKQEHDKRENDKRLSVAVDKLYEEIASTCVEKMKAASCNGHFYATLFSFTNHDMFEKFKTVFLIKGPLRKHYVDSLMYFENMNIVPILHRLRNLYEPIHIYMKYDRMNSVHHIMATWKNDT